MSLRVSVNTVLAARLLLKKTFFFNWTDKGELKTLPNTDWCFQPVTGVLFVAQHDWISFMRKRLAYYRPTAYFCQFKYEQ